MTAYRLAAVTASLVAAVLWLQWQVIDKAPPTWDDAWYLLIALKDYEGFKNDGVHGLWSAFLSADPSRAPLIGLLGQPGYFLFGPTAKAGIASFIIVWPLSILLAFDATERTARLLFGFDLASAGRSGLIGCALFALYPLSIHLSSIFWTEIPLIACVLAIHVGALRYYESGHSIWELATGVALMAGFLAKVTFPAFAIPAAAIVLARFAAQRREIPFAVTLFALPSLIGAAPYYYVNRAAILAMTRSLTSAETASVFGLGGAWDWGKSLEFFLNMIGQYEFAICVVAMTLFAIWALANHRTGWFAIFFVGFLIPFLFVALSNFKLERYAYPGFVPLFILAGMGLALLSRAQRQLGLAIVLLLLIPMFAKAAITYSILPSWAMPERAGPAAPTADPREWHSAELVAFAERHAISPGPIMQLGGSPAFHASLYQFISNTQGSRRTWLVFPYSGYPNMTARDIVRFLDEQNPAAVLYKGPPTYMFLGNFATEAIAHLRANEYQPLEIPITQPDGSQFTLFIATKPSVEILSRGSVQGPHLPPNSTLFNFADRYSESAIKFESEKTRVVVALTFERIGAPVSGETVFFHLLNEKGDIIHQLDRPVCMGCNDPANVTVWTERFYIAKDIIGTFKSIGFGIYGPSSGTAPLVVQGLTTDWSGHRALVRLPSELAASND